MSQGGRDNGEAFPAASASSHRAFWPRSIELSSGFGKLFNDPADHSPSLRSRRDSRNVANGESRLGSSRVQIQFDYQLDMFARYAWKLSGFEGCLLPLLGWLAWLFVTKYLLVAANPAIWIFDQGIPCLRRSVPDEMGAPK
ncbi:hypothetical protein CTAM01_10221 [Colletotrichum tamarilloi]|uniref:Uncharacterized protein n=1 Tax=Colletotrichum tamarilloi TaxID=1209934 RepID=A0ABQ9R156_9PEZI|nr:uncharacterized protein CTAM01_10221 [Colletotrichum tamarilloi]KAK1491898.1 hypothetical protein CTAM01_10221 [Colletotrichum tamarilloi]